MAALMQVEKAQLSGRGDGNRKKRMDLRFRRTDQGAKEFGQGGRWIQNQNPGTSRGRHTSLKPILSIHSGKNFRKRAELGELSIAVG